MFDPKSSLTSTSFTFVSVFEKREDLFLNKACMMWCQGNLMVELVYDIDIAQYWLVTGAALSVI